MSPVLDATFRELRNNTFNTSARIRSGSLTEVEVDAVSPGSRERRLSEGEAADADVSLFAVGRQWALEMIAVRAAVDAVERPVTRAGTRGPTIARAIRTAAPPLPDLGLCEPRVATRSEPRRTTGGKKPKSMLDA